MKDLDAMTPHEVIEEYDRQGRREGWPPTEPRLLAKFRWASDQIRLAYARDQTLARAARVSAVAFSAGPTARVRTDGTSRRLAVEVCSS